MITLDSGLNGLFKKKKPVTQVIKTPPVGLKFIPNTGVKPNLVTRPVQVARPIQATRPVLVRPSIPARPVQNPIVKGTQKPVLTRPASALTQSEPRRPASAFNRPVQTTKPVNAPVLTRPATVKKPVLASKPSKATRPSKGIKPRRKPITAVSNLTPATIKKAEVLQQAGIMPNVAQLETIADAKGTSVEQEVNKIVANAPEVLGDTGLETPPKNNTMLYVGGGIVALGIAYVAFK